MQNKSNSENIVAFQGEPGAYSNLACRTVFPDMDSLPCHTFEDVFAAVEEKRAKYAMIPIENSVAGRVAAIHHLIPHASLHIIGEHFQRINHHLLAIPGATMNSLKSVRSHEQALGQCRNNLLGWGLEPDVYSDTAGAAKLISELQDPSIGAIASSLAGEIYGLQSLKKDIEDAAHNTTRFVVFSREPLIDLPNKGLTITSFVFQVRNSPASLYKVMGGFATNGVNMTKLESYQLNGDFVATQFYADIEGHPDDPGVQHAFDELKFFTNEFRILGSYPAAQYRLDRR
ncbi:prephenate dehydratase [Paremcibacter congregatus]|uniref:prephenate dehydratase n=1 Tax=Paremcibacter congregatus TaxID=2043170 RepID=A0A2G4YWD3_9PROT|nr:prephenate dehydratase [Paremcibacter congregatus]PHZ86651.1 prephenate dehydratase [Paremcibacter congregatus]QDE26452.1 prephenate dehydratase [Paremcibacter congregatus]